MLSTPCIEWTNSRHQAGYGLRYVDGRQVYVHRWVMEQLDGPLLPGEVVCHRCDNPPYFRFDHLERGTCSHNTQDAYARGLAVNWNKKKTHCKWGHEFIPSNTYDHGGVGRSCRTCALRRASERRAGLRQLLD